MTDPRHRTNSSTIDQANVVIRPPVAWFLLVAVGLALNMLSPQTFLPIGLPAFRIGVGVFIAGIIVAVLAIVQFRRAGTRIEPHTPTVVIVDSGIFAHTRNPMYVGLYTCMVGVAVALNSLWILGMLIPLYLVIRYGVIARESQRLL